VRRESLAVIWVGGLILAVLIYVVGPDRFLDTVLNALDALDFGFRTLIQTLGMQIYGVVRALAIALYVVFVVLALLASSRGRHGIGAIIVVTLLFAMLVWRPYAYDPAPPGRWIVAFALMLVSAIIMTQRLMRAPHDGRWIPFQQPPRPPS
jgi:hypothetical protein